MVKLSLMLIIVACVWRCCAIPLRHSGKGASPYPNSTATSDYREATFEELQRAAKHSAAAYTICPGKAFDVYLTKYFTHLLTGTEGYVGYSTNRKVIAVVFRGSTSFIDVANNLDTKTVVPHIPNVEFPLGAGIMQGIYRPYMSVHDEIVMQIANLQLRYPDYAIEITGHSLGGSLVYLAHIAINQIFKDSNITSYALSAYPIGNQVYANFGAAQRGVLFRGNPKDDGVPNIYTSEPLNFRHYGVEYYSNGTPETTIRCLGTSDLRCSAGNGQKGVTLKHFQSFGVTIGPFHAKCR